MTVHEQVQGFLPDFSGVASAGSYFIYFMAFFIVTVVATLLIIRVYKYKYKIIIWDTVNGHPQIVGRDKAMEFQISLAGDTALKLMKRKKTLPTPSLQQGKNTYWYFIREDKEWINFVPESIDDVSKKMKVHFTDKEMRYARTSLQKNLKDRLQDPSFWTQHGMMIMNIAYVLIIAVSVWLIMDKWIDLANTLNNAIAMVPDILDKQEQLTLAMDNMCRGGSGFTFT